MRCCGYITCEGDFIDLNKVAYILKTRQTSSLVAACDMVGLDGNELTQHEIDIIKKLVSR